MKPIDQNTYVVRDTAASIEAQRGRLDFEEVMSRVDAGKLALQEAMGLLHGNPDTLATEIAKWAVEAETVKG